MLAVGSPPHATVIFAGAVIVGSAAGDTVIVLETATIVLPQISVAVQVSVTVPPPALGVAVKVDALDVPLIWQPPVNPLLYEIVLAAGIPPQATVIFPGAVIVGSAAGEIVIVLDTEDTVLPQLSVAVHVSVTIPPHEVGVAVNVDAFEVPLIKQLPLIPLLYEIVLAAGIAPQATVIFVGAVIVATAAGLTVIVLDTDATVLPQLSVAVHVSVTVPPHEVGVAVNVEAFEVPLIKQFPLNPLLNEIVLADGRAPQATVIFAGAVIVGSAAGPTVIVLETCATALPQLSVPVQVSVTVPPHEVGIVVKVDALEVPFTAHPPLNPLLNDKVLAAGRPPQATVIFPGAVIVATAAGLTVIVLETDATVLPQMSVPVHVSVTVPPQAAGVVVNVDGFEVPLIKQPPLNPLVNDIVLGAGRLPQATVIFAGAVIVGIAAGATVITLEVVIVLP